MFGGFFSPCKVRNGNVTIATAGQILGGSSAHRRGAGAALPPVGCRGAGAAPAPAHPSPTAKVSQEPAGLQA